MGHVARDPAALISSDLCSDGSFWTRRALLESPSHVAQGRGGDTSPYSPSVPRAAAPARCQERGIRRILHRQRRAGTARWRGTAGGNRGHVTACGVQRLARGWGLGAWGWGSPGSSHGRRARPDGTCLRRCQGRALPAGTACTLQWGQGHYHPKHVSRVTAARGRGTSAAGTLCTHLPPRRHIASFLGGTAPVRALPVPWAVLQGPGWKDRVVAH